ncbi:acyltransferase [Trichlorobacter lovleyi]|uniref:acyltransferase n=1 Tax=Trichlorobacter lovleyi TaxID=313985 RepID=UPI001ABFE102|nr:acyltransferase [Trichlorobacter lovleyi]
MEKESKLVLGRGCRLKPGTVIYVKKGASLIIGDNTSTGHDTEISVGKYVTIGSDVIMAPYTYITDSNHRFDLQDKTIREQGMDIGTVEIGNDVWIARGSMVLKDARIGNRTVIAAGAIVSKSFPDRVIIGGIPAKILKELR